MAVRKALGFTAAQQGISFWLSFASVVIVSRLLKPEEIGIFSVAVSVLGFAHVFREFGVTQYLVQAAQVGRAQLRAAFTVTLATSWAIALLLFLLRWPLSTFYGHQGIAEVLLLVSLNFVVMPFGTVRMAMLKRELRFGRVAAIGVAAILLQAVVTISCAYNGQSYLSMAWGSLAMHGCTAVLAHFMRPGLGLMWPTTQGLRAVLHFGSFTSASALMREIGNAAPDLILGRTLGFASVAVFSRGQGLYKMLVPRIDALVRQVHFPALASELRKGGDAPTLFFRASNYLSAVTLPLMAVLAALSEPLILFVFGGQWQAAVSVAVFACLGRMLTAPYALTAVTLMAAGRVKTELGAEFSALLFRVTVLLSSLWLPLDDVVRLLLLAYLFEAWVAQRALRRVFGIRPREMFLQLWKALALAPIAAVGPLLLMLGAWHFGFADQRLALLLAGGLLATLGWVSGVLLLDHPLKGEIHRLAGKLRERLRRRP